MSELTKELIFNMPTEELKRLMADPGKLAEINEVLNKKSEPVSEEVQEVVEPPAEEQTDEAVAAAEAARLGAEKLAVEKAAAEKAELKAAQEAAYKAAGVSVETDADGNITKIVKTYQAHDEDGKPVGRATYLEAKTWLELSIKQQAAHENAVRYAERLKKKPTFKKEEPAVSPQLTEDELIKLQEELKSEDRDIATKAAEQVRKNDEAKRYNDAAQAIEDARQAKESFRFLSKHLHDYNNCDANNSLLAEYIKDNELEWTADNLDIAFAAIETQLAPKEQPVPAVANPPAAAPVVTTPPPVVAAPPAQPVAQNAPAPPAPRPGVNTGLVPGQQSAGRPVVRKPGLTKEDIKNMPRDEYRRRLRDPNFVAEVNAVLAGKK